MIRRILTGLLVAASLAGCASNVKLNDVPVDRVRAAFHYVRTGRTVEPDGLPERAQLEGLVVSDRGQA